MPSINIKEVDISPVATADVTTNAVYVPGFATEGPIQEPTLCSTLSDFQRVFGSAIPKYSADVTVNGQTFTAGSPEISYVYASDLLRLGLPVLFERISDSITELNITDFWRDTDEGINKIADRNEYVIKYITSGGYPTFLEDDFTDATKFLSVATSRRDVTFLLDYSRPMLLSGSSFNESDVLDFISAWIKRVPAVGDGEQAGNYAAAFIPWGTYKSPTLFRESSNEIALAPSFAYLSALANSTQTYANWYAIAGVTRGYIPNLIGLDLNISDSVGNEIQPKNDVGINPIQNIAPYGYRIWGTRTLHDSTEAGDLVATSFLNIRQLANDVKRAVYIASKECMFEPDDDVLWINYKSKITPLLDRMQGNRGLTDYSIRRVATDAKATLKAVIRLYCIDPVEHFDITLELTDGQVTTAE